MNSHHISSVKCPPLQFAMRLAWRQMRFSHAKLFAAIMGIMFACVLVYIQTGFRDALYSSTMVAPSTIDGQLFLVHKQTEAFWRTIPFPRSELYRTMAHPDVLEVVPLYMGLAPFKNPADHSKRTLMIYGYDPYAKVMNIPEVISQKSKLTNPDTALFDLASRPEFGPVPELFKKSLVHTEINDHNFIIHGLFKLGGSFSADGNVIVSDSNFFRIFRDRTPQYVDLGVIRLKTNSNLLTVQAELQKRISPNVYLFTFDQMKQHEFEYWKKSVPIGFVFGFGMVMGLVVGMIIVYQILFTDITSHLQQYATLSAMGYPHRYFLLVVFSSSLILAVLGFIPGTLLSAVLYKVAEENIYLDMPMTISKMISIFTMILFMCIASGFLAIQKLRSVNPAEMF